MIRLDNVTKVYHLGEGDVHALRALTANKLGSSLTMLGIILA